MIPDFLLMRCCPPCQRHHSSLSPSLTPPSHHTPPHQPPTPPRTTCDHYDWRVQITIHGQPVYGAYFEGGQGYRNDNTTGVATGNDPETMYMVTSGAHYNAGCCFDYGNAGE